MGRAGNWPLGRLLRSFQGFGRLPTASADLLAIHRVLPMPDLGFKVQLPVCAGDVAALREPVCRFQSPQRAAGNGNEREHRFF